MTQNSKGGNPGKGQVAAKPKNPQQQGKGGQPQAQSTRAAQQPKPPVAPVDTTPQVVVPPRLREKYKNDISPAMMKQFSYSNVMQVPRLTKVVVNIGLGEAVSNAKALEAAVGDLTAIVGQKPMINKAKKSIAAFKLRTNMPIGASVTLRGPKMFEFLDRLINVALPRTRDFSGVSNKAFDGHGNYTLGLREQILFPEIDYDKVDRVRGMEVTIVTTAKTDEEGLQLLRLFGMPFRK